MGIWAKIPQKAESAEVEALPRKEEAICEHDSETPLSSLGA